MPEENDVYEITGNEAPVENEGVDQKREQDEALQVKALAKEYETARKFDKDPRKQYAKDRTYASGKMQETWASTANLIGSFIDILTSFLYARDPEVTVKAAKNVGGSTQDQADFAETLQIVISRLWKKARLKKGARKMLRSSLSVGPGWLKVIMTHETKKDPKVQSELNDLTDNIERLRATQQEIDEGELEHDELMVKLKDMQLLRESLTARLEVAYRHGLAIDFVQAEDMQISLDVNDISEHLDANWNGNEQYVPLSDLTTEFPRLTEKDVKAATIYYQRKEKPRTTDPEKEVDMGYGGSNRDAGRYTTDSPGEEAIPFARIIEIWDKRDNHIKTIVAGIKRWAEEPYPPPYATSRFYPYFNLSLFEVDGERHPQSLTSRLLKLQDEYSSKRSNARLATERSVPGIIFDQTGVSKQDVRKIEGSVAQELVGINPTKGDDIRKLFTEKPVARIDPLIFSTAPIMQDMERIAGIQEAMSQSVSTPKTATEAKIEQTGFTSRTSADRDTLEDVLQDLANYTAELSIQGMPLEAVVRIAGEKAFWPEGMDVEDLLTLAEVEIKAGSTGKPDDESLRQSWSVLLPLVQEVMMAIQQAQMTGNLPMAEALRNLLRETMRRLDERIDVEQFIPQGTMQMLETALDAEEGGDGQPGSRPNPEDGKTPEQQAADGNTLV